MIFLQWEQIVGLKQPPKSQTRRPDFPYELARQLWNYGWSYHHDAPWTWKEWLRDFPPTDAQIAEANRILGNNVVTLPVQPSRTEKSKGRIEATKIRRERLGEISEEDARAEGILEGPYTYQQWYANSLVPEALRPTPRLAFIDLWREIYGLAGWDRMKDDDCWVLEFETCEE